MPTLNNPRLRVLLLAPNSRGGMIHYVSHLAAELSNRAEVCVIVGEGNRQHFSPRIIIKEIDLTRGGTGRLRNLREISRTIQEWSPDVVHVTSASYLNLLVLASRKWTRVVTLHDVRLHEGESTLINRLTNSMHQRLGDQWIVHGSSSRSLLLERGHHSPGDVHVIPHGNYESLSAADNPPFPTSPRALFFGRIVEYKGLDVFIEAVKRAALVLPDLKGIIAGSGDLGPYKSSIDESRFVVLNRFIPDDELPAIMAASTVVVCPYRNGTQSGVVVLAYAFGRPVIATNVGDIPEIVPPETGCLVPPESVQATSEAIVTLLKDRVRLDTMGLQARNFSRNNLDWGIIAEKTLQVYVAAQRRGIDQ